MIKIKPTEDQKKWVKHFLSENNIAQRGKYDGSKRDQAIGKLGEKVIADVLGVDLTNKPGFDGGIDFVLGQYNVDVKTKLRRAPMRPWYAWNIPQSQFNSSNYKANCYIFCSYNDITGDLSVSGYLNKHQMRQRSSFLPKGAFRIRDDGKKFPTDEGYPLPVLEIPDCLLIPLNMWEDFKFNALNGQ